MQLFYAPDIVPPEYTLSEEESNHCIRVLRLGRGDTLHITDGAGSLHTCRIVEDHPRRCVVQVTGTIGSYEERPYRLEIGIAPTKNIDRYEWFLEKATEIGIDAVLPMVCDRSERRVVKHDRQEKVIVAAMKQSLKAYRPALHPLAAFGEVVRIPFEGRRMIAHCDTARTPAGKPFLGQVLDRGENLRILIGPEGDFSPEEIELAVANGYEEISLGPQRLRTETAAVAAAVMAATVNLLP